MERRIIGGNEIRTVRNWKNQRETVRDHGRDIAERICREREESVYWRCARPLGALREIRSRGLEEGKSAAERENNIQQYLFSG